MDFPVSSDNSAIDRYEKWLNTIDPASFTGTMALRVALGLDSYEDLLAGFAEVVVSNPESYPDTPKTKAEVWVLLRQIITNHRSMVRASSPGADALWDALETLDEQQVAITFAQAWDHNEALHLIHNELAERATGGVDAKKSQDIPARVPLPGSTGVAGATELEDDRERRAQFQDQTPYLYVTRQDADHMVLHGQLSIGFGVSIPNPEHAFAVGNLIVEVLRAEGLEVEWDRQPHHRILVHGVDYRMPFIGEIDEQPF